MLRPPYQGVTSLIFREQIERYGWTIGDHTYGNPNVMEQGRGNLTIGRFTSMADVTIILGNHDWKNVTTYPFDALRPWWPGMDGSSCHVGRSVTIGSDVWLCEKTVILPGTSIGHGAVIGAGAVVSGTIPPYAVVSGNPASVQRFRFPPALIERLVRSAWWDLPDEVINDISPMLASHDVAAFLDRVEDVRRRPDLARDDHHVIALRA